MKSGSDAAKLDRKIAERNRRTHMKSLCFKMASLIPRDGSTSKDTSTLQDHLDRASSYISKLKESVENLKERKETRMRIGGNSEQINVPVTTGFRLPVVEVRPIDSSLHVLLVSEISKRFLLHEVISLLDEEGGEVVDASCSVVGDKMFYTIHSRAICPSIGFQASKVCERLKQLVR